jgi:hypothetical protein
MEEITKGDDMKVGRLLIILMLLSGCKSNLRESIYNLKNGDGLHHVYLKMGKPDEWGIGKEDRYKIALLYRSGKINCALEFDHGKLFNRNCLETK